MVTIVKLNTAGEARIQYEGEVVRPHRESTIADDVFNLPGQQLLDAIGDHRGNA